MPARPSEIIQEHDAIEQIIGRPPGILLRLGISIIALGMCFVLGIAYFVEYPDTIPSRVVLSTENPPIRLITRTSGQLQQLNIHNNSIVKTNQILGVLESPANWTDIQLVEQTIANNEALLLKDDDSLENLSLGSIQAVWANFVQKKRAYHYFINKDLTQQKIININAQIEENNKLIQTLQTQGNTLKEVLSSRQKTKIRKETLLANQLIATDEFEQAKNAYLEARRNVEANTNNIINNRINIKQLEATRLNLQEQSQFLLADKKHSLQNALQNLEASIELWKKKYLLIAPIDGQISMTDTWSLQQYISANTALMTIVPSKQAQGAVQASAFLPTDRSGKVTVGMTSNIRLDAYPYQEYGVLEGLVESIAPVAENGNYRIQIKLKNKNLQTTYHKSIAFQQEMEGTANIITEKRSILARLFDRILSALKN